MKLFSIFLTGAIRDFRTMVLSFTCKPYMANIGRRATKHSSAADARERVKYTTAIRRLFNIIGAWEAFFGKSPWPLARENIFHGGTMD